MVISICDKKKSIKIVREIVVVQKINATFNQISTKGFDTIGVKATNIDCYLACSTMHISK